MKPGLLGPWALGATAFTIGLALVDKGWWPFDDGMLGHVAERALAGDLPHRDFDDPYTGGQGIFHAAVFRTLGVDLLYLRWALLGAYALQGVVSWLILRRYLTPLSSALTASATSLGTLLTHPTPLPTWYTTVALVFAAWLTIRWMETGRLPYLAGAGAIIGIGALFKITAVYGLAATTMIVGLRACRSDKRIDRLVGRFAIWLPVLVGSSLTFRTLTLSTATYFLVPVTLSGVLVWRLRLAGADGRRGTELLRSANVRDLAMPLMSFLLVVLGWIACKYSVSDLGTLKAGLLEQPQMRFFFASREPPPAHVILALAVALAAGIQVAVGPRPKPLVLLGVLGMCGVVVIAGWQPALLTLMTAAGVLPTVLLARLMITEATYRQELTAYLLSLAAFAQLVAFPFYSAIYVAYVGPLLALAFAAAASEWRIATYAVGSITSLGAVVTIAVGLGLYGHGFFPPEPPVYDTSRIERVSLETPNTLAYYEEITELIMTHHRGRPIWAGPDLAHFYYMSQTESITRHIYSFSDPSSYAELITTLREGCVLLVVLNTDNVVFAPPIPSNVLNQLRAMYPNVSVLADHEVRWVAIPPC